MFVTGQGVVGAVIGAGLLTACASAPVRAVSSDPAQLRVLVCAHDPHPELLAVLQKSFARVELDGPSKRCRPASLAEEFVADGCVKSAGACGLPRFVNGEAIAQPIDGFDFVFLIDRLVPHRTTRLELGKITPGRALVDGRDSGAAIANAVLAGILAIAGAGHASETTIRTDAPGLSGPVYLFVPADGRVLAGRQVAGASAQVLQAVLLEFLGPRPYPPPTL